MVFGSYRYAERIFLILSLAFLAYPVAAILGHPNWVEVGTTWSSRTSCTQRGSCRWAWP